MKQKMALSAIAALGLSSVSLPAQAAKLRWNVEYSDFFSNGASILGSLEADEAAADDGIVSDDEFTAWAWTWSGNSTVDAFAISSSAGEVATPASGGASFYIDGTPNQPFVGLDQGLFVSDTGDLALDLEFLLVEDFNAGTLTSGLAGATVNISEPEKVLEPATTLASVLAMATAAAVARRQRHLSRLSKEL